MKNIHDVVRANCPKNCGGVMKPIFQVSLVRCFVFGIWAALFSALYSEAQILVPEIVIHEINYNSSIVLNHAWGKKQKK